MYFCQLYKDTVLKVQISEKVLKDLEFTTILDQVAECSISELGRQKILQIKPIENRADLLEELKATNEYLSSFESDNRIPNHRFDNLYEQTQFSPLNTARQFSCCSDKPFTFEAYNKK